VKKNPGGGIDHHQTGETKVLLDRPKKPETVQAEVAAGRLYFVHVVPHLGAWLARVELDPVKPSEDDWRSLSAWLAQTNRLKPVIAKTAVSVSQGRPTRNARFSRGSSMPRRPS
jgi:hypothetical protein